VTTDLEPPRPLASTRPHKARPLSLLALLALAGAACSDDTSPTAPQAVEPAATVTAAAPAKPRTPYISDVQLHYIYIDMGPDGTYDNRVDIELTNPGPKATGLHLKATVQDNHYTVDGGSLTLVCPTPDGSLPRGTCRLRFFVTPPPHWLELGPAKLTITLMQRGLDNSITALDRRTLDVILVHS
jgi:hypothetical protein